MEKAYLNIVDDLFKDQYNICVNLMEEIINRYPNFDYNFIPWCPMAYGPKIGYTDRKTNDMICVLPECVLYNINREQGRIDIDSLSVEEIINLIGEKINN